MEFMELLAPAGTIETFWAALDGGADAVYVGAPGFNARNLARDLRIEEIGGMIHHCHGLGKKLYVAANSLILEQELPQVIENLALLQELDADGLIVQDLGLMHIIKKFFPRLKLHGSTLATVHNSDGVRFFGEHGCERVVLSRELTLKEIKAITSRRGNTEIEIFIHGAMCFSYSGLCLFSSYLGGKSSLRGRCTQPCRRAYSFANKRPRGKAKKTSSSSYLFSMNDLNGLEAVSLLRSYGIASLKIEGRLRSAHYVKSIVGAYRKVLDTPVEDQEESLIEAQALAAQAMSRKTSSGYFFSPQPLEAITAHHSGNVGIHLGRFTTVRMIDDRYICRFVTKADLAAGDRIRLHMEPSGERLSFRLQSLFVSGQRVQRAIGGDRVSIALGGEFSKGSSGHVEVYKVDGAMRPESLSMGKLPLEEIDKMLVAKRKRLVANIGSTVAKVCGDGTRGDEGTGKFRGSSLRHRFRGKRLPLEWWLKTDSIKLVLGDLPFSPDRYVLSFDKQTISQIGMLKSTLGKRIKKIIWALPPIIMENDLPRYRKQIQVLLRSGFRSFQLGHVSQAVFFVGEKTHLFGDYTLNLVNSQAVAKLCEIGLDAVQMAIENDRVSQQQLLAGYRLGDTIFGRRKPAKKIPLGLTVYGTPALYTARLSPRHLYFDRQFLSPKNEPFITRKKEGFIQTYSTKPFSLLPYLDELKEMGLSYVVVDISGGNISKRELLQLKERLANSGRYGKLATFNYFTKLE